MQWQLHGQRSRQGHGQRQDRGMQRPLQKRAQENGLGVAQSQNKPLQLRAHKSRHTTARLKMTAFSQRSFSNACTTATSLRLGPTSPEDVPSDPHTQPGVRWFGSLLQGEGGDHVAHGHLPLSGTTEPDPSERPVSSSPY